MEKISSLIQCPHRFLFYGLFLFFCLSIITGCISSGKPQMQMESYLIDYPVPVWKKFKKIEDTTIRVDRFNIATAYNNRNMVFRPDDYALDSFNYNRWAVNPADMVGDNILRDLQASELFRAVFPRYAVDEGRYIIQGGVEDFFLLLHKDGNKAVLGLAITLKDTRKREATRRILFQKKYRQEEALADQSPRGYCQAMSQAMQKLSEQIINDIYLAIRTAENK